MQGKPVLMNKYGPTTWGCFMTSISKSLWRFVISGAGQIVPFSLPAERRTYSVFLSLMAFYITVENFLSFPSLLKVTTKHDKSSITIFLSLSPPIIFTSVCFFLWFYTLGPTGCLACFPFEFVVFSDGGTEKQNSFLLTNHRWKQPALTIFLLNGSQKVEILLTKHRNYYFANKLV